VFGVGCSFADTPEERIRRNEIMDQACRGWFTDGYLQEPIVMEQNEERKYNENNHSTFQIHSCIPRAKINSDPIESNESQQQTFLAPISLIRS